MEGLTEYKSYQEYKAELDLELRRTTEAFVKIGYLLKLARDTDILRGSGYGNVVDFAKAEYGIDKTQVSRFIHINDRFSEGGYSPRLKEQYQGFGHAKLSIMLLLPDEINEELSRDYSKAEIQAIKEEVDEEKKKTQIELLLEGQKQEQHGMDNIHKVIHQLGKDEPELYVSLHDAVSAPGDGLAAVRGILAPAGEKLYSVRVQGIGRFMLSIKEKDTLVSLTNIRCPEGKEYLSWETVLEAVRSVMVPGMPPEESWSATYKEAYPKKKVAPVQPEKEKADRKKETKVQKAKKEIPKAPQKPETTECGTVSEGQLPGQMEVSDFPQYMPDPPETEPLREEAGKEEVWPGTVEDGKNLQERNPENVINTECGGLPEDAAEIIAEDAGQGKEPYEEAYLDAIAQANRDFGRKLYGDVLRHLGEAEKSIRGILALPAAGGDEDEE